MKKINSLTILRAFAYLLGFVGFAMITLNVVKVALKINERFQFFFN